MKFYKQGIISSITRIFLVAIMTQKCIAKYPYSLLHAEKTVNELKAIDVINSTDKIRHGELLIYNEFQFADLSYFHKWFIWHFNHISQPFKVTRLFYVQRQPERNDDSGHAKNPVKKKQPRNIFLLFLLLF